MSHDPFIIQAGYRIVPATIHDVKAIYRVDQKSFKLWKDTWSLRYLINQLASPDLRVTVAREGFGDEEVVGFLMTTEESVVKIGVSVLRRGIGRGLLEEWKQKRDQSLPVSTLIRHRNEPSVGLFSSVGFVMSKRLNRTWGQWTLTPASGP